MTYENTVEPTPCDKNENMSVFSVKLKLANILFVFHQYMSPYIILTFLCQKSQGLIRGTILRDLCLGPFTS